LEDIDGAIWSVEMKDFVKQWFVVLIPPHVAILIYITCGHLSLIVDGSHRPKPRMMLEHPWILKKASQKVDMAKWISSVWGWPDQPDG
jgi:hypothetical protein